MTEYTADQIREAIREINGLGREGTVSDIVVWKYKKFIDALPDPKDYPEIEFDQVQNGDRVRVRDDEGNFYEFTMSRRDKHCIYWDTKCDKEFIYRHEINNIWLLDRPIEHPDPTKNPTILIHRASGVRHDPPALAIARWNTMTDEFHYLFKETGVRYPSDITDWEPAKIVPEGTNDDR